MDPSVAALIALSLAIATPATHPPTIEVAVGQMMNAEFDEARRALAQLAAVRPGDPEVSFYGVAACWWAEISRDPDGDGAACLDSLERALARIDDHLDREPDDALAHYFRGRLLGQRVRINALGGRARKLAGDLRRLHAALERAEELDPSIRARSVELALYHSIIDRIPSMARFLRFLMFVPGGDKEEGLERLHLIASGSSLEAAEAELYIGLIEIRFESRVARGVDRLHALMLRHPGNPFLPIHLGDTVRKRLRQPREAGRLYRRGQRMAGELVAAERWARLGVALTLADARDLDGAIELLEPLTVFDDSTAEEALIGLVAVHMLRGDGPSAQAAYRRMQRFERRWSERYRGLALGVLRKPPSDSEIAISRALSEGHAAQRRGDLAAAESAFQRARTVANGDARARLALAELDFANGRLDPVRRACEHLTRVGGVPAEIAAICRLRLAQVADVSGDRRTAVIRYDEVLDLPGLPHLKAEARRFLRAPFQSDGAAARTTGPTADGL